MYLVKLLRMYVGTIAVFSLILAHLGGFSESQKCEKGQIYENHFSRCCDNNPCKPGTYYNCIECLDCPLGTFLGESSWKTVCQSHTKCSDHESEIWPGNATHDRVCGPPELTTNQYSSSASPNDSYIATQSAGNEANTGQLVANIAIPIFICFALALVAVVILVLWKKRHLRCGVITNEASPGQHANGNPESIVMIVKTKDEMAIAERNIKKYRSQLCRDMDSDKGLFWAALKEGKNSFTLEDHQTCMKMTSFERNGKILDLALIKKNKIKSLIYALVLSEQCSLAKLISETMSDEEFKEKSEKWTPGTNNKIMLTNNRVFILKNLDLNEELWSHLRENDSFTVEDYETCKAKTTEYGGKDYIIDAILKDEQKYLSFLRALKNTENDLYEKLVETHQNASNEHQTLMQQEQGNKEV